MKTMGLAFVVWAAVGAPRAAYAQDFVEQIQAGLKHEWFGYSLVTDGTTLVAGDPQYDNTTNDCSSGYGAVNIYNKSGSTWPTTPSQTFTFTSTPGEIDEENNYGHFLSLANNVLVVSSERDDESLSVRAVGCFFVYRRSGPGASFAQIGRVFMPNAQGGERFTSVAGVATNGTYIAAAPTPGHPNANQVFVYQIQGNTVPTTPTVTVTLPFNSNIPINRMVITANNTLVAVVQGMPTPFAYQLNGAATPTAVNMSASANGSDTTTPTVASDGNTVVVIKQTTVAPINYYPQVLTFSTTGLATVSAQQMPLAYYTDTPFSGPTTLTVKENQGFFFLYGVNTQTGPLNSFIVGYKYFNGQYYPGGIVRGDQGGYTFPQSGMGNGLAFDGTDLFLGDTSLPITTEGSNHCTSPGATGAIDVFHTTNTSGTGPHTSVELEPWLNSTVSNMGRATATNGTYVVTGSPNDIDATTSEGEMTVFENVSGVWQQVVKYSDADDGIDGTPLGQSGFGTSVDINANFIAIGAPTAFNASNQLQTGAVYTSNGVFQGGPFLNEVDPPSTAPAGAYFGQSVGLAGTTLVVGAPSSSSVGGTGLPTRGAVYIYTYQTTTRSFALTQTLHPTGSGDNDYENFGWTVDIDASATYIIVGIPNRAGTTAAVQGAVQIFTKVNGAFVSGGEFLAPSNTPPYTNMGTAVSIGANYAVAGSRIAGTVMVFRRTGNTWVQDTVIQPFTFGFGAALALDGTRFAAGSPGEGKVYRYERINNAWTRTATLTSTAGTSSFGASLDTKNGTLAIGDYNALTGTISPTVSGAAYVIGLTGF
jgi:hypothetical protein